MTEPDTASSDATNIGTRIRRDGDHYVVSGRKWWSTGAMNPDAAIFIVMGKTDPDADRHRQQSMILVPRDTPGVRIVRPLSVFGYDDRDHGGHAEIAFDDVRVPAANLIGEEGSGFAIAQARLGPGPHPPLHARARHGRARPVARAGARERASRVRPDARRAGRRSASGRRSPASSSRRCACSCSRPPGSWTPSATGRR